MNKRFTILMMLLLSFIGMARAAVVQIGNSTNEPSQYLPIKPDWNYSLTQQIFTADEIGTAGTINSIAFDFFGVAGINPPGTEFSFENTKVYMKHVNKTTFTSDTDMVPVNESNKVFEGTFSTTCTGWVTITLDTPFEYDGMNNLLVCISSYGVDGLNCTFYCTSTGDDYRALVYFDDSFVPDLNNLANYQGGRVLRTYRANIRMDITCEKPQNLNFINITSTSAFAVWEDGSGSFTYEYKKSYDTEWNVRCADGCGWNITMTNLEPGTPYDFRVRSICNDDYSDWTTGCFTTQCEIITSPSWSENFDSYPGSTDIPADYPNDVLPACWQFLNRSTSSTSYPQAFISSNTNYAISGNSLLFKSSSSTPLYAILPEFDRGVSDLLLTFTYRNENISGNNGILYVGYMNDPTDASTFHTIDTCTRTNWPTSHEVLFEGSMADKRIAFKYVGGLSDNYYLCIDDVSVNHICPQPKNLHFESISYNYAFAMWGGGTGYFQYECREVSNPNWTEICQNPDGCGYNCGLVGLEPNTTYVFRVRSICDEEGFSSWTTASFTTSVACEGPIDFQVSVTSTVAEISWDVADGWHSYTAEYKESTSSTWLTIGNPPIGNSIGLYFLNPETTYDLRVKHHCQNGYDSDWEEIQFTTWPACPPVNNFRCIAVDSYSVTLDWDPIDETQDAWEIGYKLDDDVYYIRFADPTEHPYTLIGYDNLGLLPETHYTAKIRANCGADGYSTWSEEIEFTTLEACPVPTDVTITNVTARGFSATFTPGSPSQSLWFFNVTTNNTDPYTNVVISNGSTTDYQGFGIDNILSPETTYYLWMGVACEDDNTIHWAEPVSFTTIELCPAPTNLEATNITPYSATLQWEGSAESYDVEYRQCTGIGYNTLVNEGFENTLHPFPSGWLKRKNGSGEGWSVLNTSNNPYSYQGNGFIASAQVEGDSRIDNWLIIPISDLNGILTFWTRKYDTNQGNFRVYVSTTGTATNDFTQVATITLTTTYRKFTLDLTSTNYEGAGYIALRHFTPINSNAAAAVLVDNVVFRSETEIWSSWIAAGNTTDNSLELTELSPETLYQFRVKAHCEDEILSGWSSLGSFTSALMPIFVTDGNWNNGSCWNTGTVPAQGSNVVIAANVVIPAGYTAIANEVNIEDGGSITINDGGQLKHNTEGLVVTMKKNIEAYTQVNGTSNYYLLAFPFREAKALPENMTANPDYDLYSFTSYYLDAEWRNNKSTPHTMLYNCTGYLYASPEPLELSLTGSTYNTNVALGLSLSYPEGPNNLFDGWYLEGNPFTCSVYIYTLNSDGYVPMEVMVYDEEGELVTLVGGPIAPMQGFFIKVTELTSIFFTPHYEIPAGALQGKFTVNNYGDQVNFSKGNLQYTQSTQTWSFMEHQYDIVETVNVLDNYANQDVISLFGWGTSGYNHGAVCYQPWCTNDTEANYWAYGNSDYNLFDQTGQADWGYNAISNGGNVHNLWRTLTNFEWRYIFNQRTTNSGIRYAKACVCGVNGMILLPDDWDASYFSLNNTNSSDAVFSDNTLNDTQWNTLEWYGAVFLPAAGFRNGTYIPYVGNYGSYWSASESNTLTSGRVNFNNGYCSPFDALPRCGGANVRLVCPVGK